MKRLVKAVIAVSMSALWLPLAAGEEISADIAEDAVRGWINLREALSAEITAEPESVLQYTANDGQGKYYVVNLKGGGFVVTSGDTAMEPILAYSKEGVWNTNAAENPLMAMLNIDVAAMMAELCSANTNNAAHATASVQQQGGGLRLAGTASVQQQDGKAAKWARLRAAASGKGGLRLQASKPTADLRCDQLVQSKWGQSGHGENYYTPGSAVCGCVATMGGQTMRFWQYPTTSISAIANWYGSCNYSGTQKGWDVNGYDASASATTRTAWNPAFGGTYNWSYIKLSPSSYDSSTYKAAIGKLTRDVGMTCFMNYNQNNSGASGAPGAVFGHRIVDQFTYANSKITSGWNDSSRAAMLGSLDAGLPCPTLVPAHAIVADGYGYDGSGTLYVHFNFGWTGSSDGWYAPPDLSAANSKFTSIQDVMYNVYPPSKGDPDLTIVSGVVKNGSSRVGGATVTAVCRETGRSYTTTSASSTGKYALMLPAGLHTITATSGSSSTRVIQRVKSCLTSIAAGAGGISYSGSVENIYGLDLDLAAGGAYSVSTSLAHRWSLNGNLNDSQGGATATKVGSKVTIADGKAKLTGSGNGAGSLKLGTNLLNTEAATIEIWASQTAARNWARVFDYGADNTHYFCLTWSSGTDIANDRAGTKNTTEVAVDTSMAPYKLGRQFHISATFERQRDGTTFVRWMRRDAATGVLQKSGTMTIPNGIQSISNPVLYLGHSFYTADSDACAEYDEVRIWNGILSDVQLSANANAGPDEIMPPPEITRTMKATWKGGTTAPTAAALANSANWTCLDQNGSTISGALPDANTTVIIPGGNTAFTIPSGYTPNWRKVQFGNDGTTTYWGSKAAGNSGNRAFKDAAMGDYALQGEGSVDNLHNGIIPNPGMNYPSGLLNKQFRYDGWFYVSRAQAGNWGLHGFVDDYMAFMVDDEWAIFGLSCQQAYANIDVKEGWHRFRLIVGDTGGGYGGRILESNHHFVTPLTVKINGAGEYAFSPEHFTFGSGTQTVKLSSDCDWRALGDVAVDSGATIDLNGHELKVNAIAGDSLNAKVTSSAAGAKLSVYNGTVNANNLTVDNVTVATTRAATPTSPTATTFYTTPYSVTLQCTTSGATIYYTTDGSEPTKSSTAYTGPITITGTATIKVAAFADAYIESETFTQTFTLVEMVATPTSPTATTFFANSHSVTLQCTTSGATIRYTTNGSEPTSSSTAYTGPITITGTTTIKAKAFKSGYRDSETFTQTFTLAGTVATPAFSPAAMTFFNIPQQVTLSCETAGATIRYTTNGSDPTASSTAYNGAILLNGTTTIKAKAFVTFTGGTFASVTASATYTLAPQAEASGSYTSNYRSGSVSLASEIDGATIYYTTNGTTPTTSSLVYDGSFVFDRNNSTGTIKAIAYADGYRPSEVFTIDYYLKQFFGPTNGPNAAVWEDTPQNRADYWIFENEDYKEATGLWSNTVEYVDHKVAIEEQNEFTADNPSAGRNVIIETTATFNSMAEDHQDYDGVKAAVRIGKVGDGDDEETCFQVFTQTNGVRVWQNADFALPSGKGGLNVHLRPVAGREYPIRIELDCTNKTYSVSVDVEDGFEELQVDGRTSFNFACANTVPYVQSVGYIGEGSVASIYGSYTNKVVVFCVDDVVPGAGGTSTTLTADQAAWLNGIGEHGAVAAKIATLTHDQLDKAYLLNEDVMDASYSVDGWGSFQISDIAVDDVNDKIVVKVKLVRNFALKEGETAAPIKGTLKIYGGADVSAINTEITDANYELKDNDVHFRDGQEATFTIDKADVNFFRAVIE